MKIVTYKRLSKEDRTRNQHGFDSQQRDIDIFLGQQENCKIVGEFQEFVSGAADVKPELEKAMQLCKEAGATLVIAKVDRLSRRTSQVTAYLEGDVKFKVACMPNADNFQITIYAALAEQERKFIQDRVKKGLGAAKAKGIKLGAANPKHRETYQRNKAAGLHKTPERQQQATDLIKRVQQMVHDSNGSMTQVEMVTRLNNEGFKTARGKMLTQGTLSHIIKKHC